MSQHVPAWKRLGLKLKYARELADSAQLSSTTGSNDSDSVSKKRKQRADSGFTNGTLRNGHVPDHSTRSANDIQHQPFKKRKSVSFTEDTKDEDGDSRITIDFPPGKTGPAASKRKGASGQHADQTSQADGNNAKSSPKKTKERNARSGNQVSSFSTARKSVDSLDYLKLHHEDFGSWKFNKNREIWILKNVLSTQAIPPAWNRALAGYIHGLPSQSAARKRLEQQCRQALDDNPDNEGLHEPPSDYEEVLLEDLEQQRPPRHDPNYITWLEQHSRVKILALALGIAHSEFENHVSTGKRQAISFTKKRKARTTAPVEISSSSSSDDSSDRQSSFDSDSDTNSKGVGKNGTASVDETSSSGSSPTSESDTDGTDDTDQSSNSDNES